jgi:DNA-binding NarL/FixJ family response regulator
MIRVFIVAASPLTRAGLEKLLSASGLEVVGGTATLEFLAEQV